MTPMSACQLQTYMEFIQNHQNKVDDKVRVSLSGSAITGDRPPDLQLCEITGKASCLDINPFHKHCMSYTLQKGLMTLTARRTMFVGRHVCATLLRGSLSAFMTCGSQGITLMPQKCGWMQDCNSCSTRMPEAAQKLCSCSSYH